MSKSRVLIVDDQALMRNHMNRLLKNEGYELFFAENGLEAVDKVNEVLPDLILLDVRLPGIDGFEVCQRVRANSMTADIPIIMVTAFDDRASRLRGIEAGADDFIPKPYDTLELQARVRTITRLNRYRRISNEKAKFELVAELSENGYLLINEQNQIVFANHQARLYLKVLAETEFPFPIRFLDLVDQSYQRESAEAWANWPHPPANHQIRYLLRQETARQSVLWLQVDTLQNLVADGETVWVISIRDVTSQIVTRQDMWKFQRAIHHKMRTPLIGMYSGVQFLAGYSQDMPAKDVKELLDTALAHGERLRESVEDVLRYIDTPTLAQGTSRFHADQLDELVAGVVDSLKLEGVRVHIEPDVLQYASAISTESMELILWELLENTRKFHLENNPSVEIELSTNPHKKHTVLVVRDNGRGIPAEHLRKVWEPYYQVEKNFTGEVAGMGLGLSAVASVVWGVGGQCVMRNRSDGEGVEAIVSVPHFVAEKD